MNEQVDPIDRVTTAFEEVFAKYRVLDDFQPLHESQIWAVNNRYWQHAGPTAFTRDAVPYYATSDGALSVATADLLVCVARSQGKHRAGMSRIALIELGPGTGLFARITAQRYTRARAHDPALPALDYLGIDCAQSMLEGIRERALLDVGDVRASFATIDLARNLCQLQATIRNRLSEGMPVIVVANYVLDSLPSMVLRREGGCINELLAELRSPDPRPGRLDHPQLLVRQRSRPAPPEDCFTRLAERFLQKDGDQLVINRSALLLLQALTQAIGDEGMIVINDYSAEIHEAGAIGWQHFGGSIAVGLHFPSLHTFVADQLSWSVVEPESTTSSITSRLLVAHRDADVMRAYRNLFSHSGVRQAQALVVGARVAREQGRNGEAAACYEAAALAQPENWSVITEAAGFLLSVMNESRAAARLAGLALEINPFSASAWNILGDSSYQDGDIPAAAAAYQKAQAVPGSDARALLNLAYCACMNGQLQEALAWIARALATDANGPLTTEILNRQAEIIARLSGARTHTEAQSSSV